jgi:hypothetical protein
MKRMKKGISYFIAAILLIAFAVSIGGLISAWLISFTRTSTSTVGQQASTQISCSYGGVDLKNLRYINSYLSGQILNTGMITLGNLSLYVIYSNSSQQRFKLCSTGGVVVNCSDGYNLTLSPSDLISFNFSASSNYNRIRVSTNCTSIYDEALSSEVSTS